MEPAPAPATPILSSASTISTPGSQPSYTILRIKRKRNEEPLDALVVDSRVKRKKSRPGVGVFQYAKTVEDSAWENEAKQKDIQDEISRLARETVAKAASDAKVNVPPTGQPQTPGSPIARITKDELPATARRFTIVDSEVSEPKRRYPTAPPTVYSYKELEARKNARDFKMYDAVPSTTATPMSIDEPSDMDNFLPMLNDYLSLNDSKASAASPKKSSANSAAQLNGKAPVTAVDDSDDYVWDVFYHRPATLSEWNTVANVGTVTGLPPSFGDTYDSASDSEEEVDEADEDSNAEEYYKNDYPDEDPESSDEWHENSDYDDMMEYPNEGEQFDWR